MKAKRIVLLVVFMVSVSYFLLSSSGTGYPYYMPMMYHAYSNSLGYVDLIFLWLGLSSFVLLVIDFIPKAVKKEPHALYVLNERLSRGDMSVEDYKKIKKEISWGD